MKHLRIKSTWQAARDAGKQVLDEVAELGYDEHCMFAIRLAMEEGLNNAIKHGCCLDPEKFIALDYAVTPEQVELIITDEGCGFTPDAVPDPTHEDNIEKPGGRGVMLMRAFVDTVEFNEQGNQVRLVKKRVS